MKVGYLVPAYGGRVDSRIWKQGVLEGIASAEAGYDLYPVELDVNGVDLARNQGLESARAQGMDYLFMQDADTLCQGPVIAHLLEIAARKEAAVVALAYLLRRTDPTVSVFPLPDDDGAELACGPGVTRLSLPSSSGWDAERAGTGLMLVDVAAVNRIAQSYDGPWFRRTYLGRGAVLDEGGDFYFCRVVREHGERVWIAGGFTTVHAHREDMELTYGS